MSKAELYPKPSRAMTTDEGQEYFNQLVKKIKDYNPDGIVAVARSGFSYASWITQRLDIKNLGVYYPITGEIDFRQAKRIALIDDHIVTGETYRETLEFMKQYPDIEWVYGVFFIDYLAPDDIKNDPRMVAGTVLDYFVQGSYWGDQRHLTETGPKFRTRVDSL